MQERKAYPFHAVIGNAHKLNIGSYMSVPNHCKTMQKIKKTYINGEKRGKKAGEAKKK